MGCPFGNPDTVGIRIWGLSEVISRHFWICNLKIGLLKSGERGCGLAIVGIKLGDLYFFYREILTNKRTKEKKAENSTF